MFAQFEALIRDIDRQIEVKQERLAEQRAALGDIQAGLDRLQRALAQEPVEPHRPAKGTPVAPAASERVYAPPGASDEASAPTSTTTTAAAVGEATPGGGCEATSEATETPRSNGAALPAGPTCQAPGCSNPVPSTDGQPGPPRRYCSAGCRTAAREQRRLERAGVEVPVVADTPFAPVPGASDS